jgi:YggT family protein
LGGGLAGFICFIISSLLSLMLLAIILNAVLSWLIAFDVINTRNRFVGQLAYTLDMVVGPILAPLRAFIPSLGGLDITPIIAWIVISGMQRYLLPTGCAALYELLGGGI